MMALEHGFNVVIEKPMTFIGRSKTIERKKWKKQD
jgi:hypothetical protein